MARLNFLVQYEILKGIQGTVHYVDGNARDWASLVVRFVRTMSHVTKWNSHHLGIVSESRDFTVSINIYNVHIKHELTSSTTMNKSTFDQYLDYSVRYIRGTHENENIITSKLLQRCLYCSRNCK